MDIIKFQDFRMINENLHDKPEEYVKMALNKIKSKLESMFDTGDQQDVEKFSDRNRKEKEETNLSDFNVNLDSIELSRYSKVQDSVKVIFSDDSSRYDLTIVIDLKDGVSTDEDKDFSDNDIKKCYIKFKRYDVSKSFELVGETSKTIDIKDINTDLLVSLKMELDDEFGGEDEKLDIETE